ncbi:glycosyltransferase [Nocardia yamanashiensis]|uniref:glycosyltransferase n=1 Tax=Nocardia yamanashiensis TaxID=209247 RepID=UPI001E5D786A|nr:glycosyltransferase [Nocardia yamanashiensis]UGT41072.1 glycosyltransferase [Nocardia yamanashiensis]
MSELPGLATPAERERALHAAVHGLREDNPMASASVAFLPWQRNTVLAVCAVLLGCAVFAPMPTLTAVIAAATLGYIAVMVDRVLVFARGMSRDAILTIDDATARALPDEQLPPYTILVPAYGEPEVVGDLIAALNGLDYPRDRMQALLLLEEDDTPTIEAARRAGIGTAGSEHITIVLVPAADPRTKPKACNYGLHAATGDIVTIYDAEDIPDPLQLRRVVAAFAGLPRSVVCIQAKLAFHNARQNLLTSWFTMDYGLWFSFLLPGLMRSSAPIPLGGTSNHFRRNVLTAIGAWDPYNVTEDADLGVRIAARGYSTAVIDSVTLEEANPDAINWIRQRSRWYKGYLQSWLVHARRPVELWRKIGPVSFLRFTLILAGTPIIACLNLVFWFVTLAWIFGQPEVIEKMFPAAVYFPALIALVLGNAATVYMNMIACRENDRPDLLLACLTSPLYWVLMAVAAAKGCWQLVRNPSYWEKTFHGLGTSSEDKS